MDWGQAFDDTARDEAFSPHTPETWYSRDLEARQPLRDENFEADGDL